MLYIMIYNKLGFAGGTFDRTKKLLAKANHSTHFL